MLYNILILILARVIERNWCSARVFVALVFASGLSTAAAEGLGFTPLLRAPLTMSTTSEMIRTEAHVQFSSLAGELVV